MGRWARRGSVGLVGLALALGAWYWLHLAWLDGQASLAEEEVAAGRFEPARERLRRLSLERPDDPAVSYLLGVCEEQLGDTERAAAAWERVAPGTALGARAAVGLGRVRLGQGRYADGERALTAALGSPRTGPEAAMVRELLAVYYRLEGRPAEVGPLVERVWALTVDSGLAGDPRRAEVSAPRDLLRQHAAIDLEPVPVAEFRRTLERAESLAPGDDRVWLGLANLARVEGDHAEADRRLTACEASRPDDPAVARSRLEWTLAVGDASRALDAIGRLPEGELGPAEVLDLSARLARLARDAAAERRALESLLAIDPGRIEALGRLADLAAAAGDAGRAADLRRRKADLDALLNRYRGAYFRADVPTAAAELAGWAEALGRRFEARAWWSLLAAARPGDPLPRARIRQLAAEAPAPASRPTLADLRAELAGRAEAFEGGGTPVDRPGPGRFAFADDAEAAGLRFAYRNGRTELRQLPETMGGGVALLDYDGDRRLDVFCVQGGPLDPDLDPEAPGDRLFRNRGDGTFEDVTEAAGLPGTTRGFGNGVAVGDYDGDGRPDLFITRLDSYALYRNTGAGGFEDATESAGLAGPRDWPTSAAFADPDGDGDLDLYVCHYAEWDVRDPRVCRRADGTPNYCRPSVVAATRDRLFRNDGGRFVDVSDEAGITAGDADGRGLGVVAADLDGDGRVNFFVANDTTANYLWRNLGGFRFEEVGLAAGAAANASGGFQAGMGVACGDVDGDGLPDLAVTNFYGESTTLFRNLGSGLFVDRTSEAGLLAASRSLLGFGAAFLDADNDGALDLLTANGHVSDERPGFPYEMRPQLLAGDGRGRLVDVSPGAGPPFEVPALGRGLAVGDLDDDGRLDALIVNQDRPLVYLHNRAREGRWIRFTLEGTESNRDGVGAVITIRAGGRSRVGYRLGGGSYQSASDGRVHFGLGADDRVDAVEVRWPSGRVDRFADLRADADYWLREGSPAPLRLSGPGG